MKVREVLRVIPRVLAYTTGFTENGIWEKDRFGEDDCAFSLGPVELEVPLEYHCGILNKQWDTASGI